MTRKPHLAFVAVLGITALVLSAGVAGAAGDTEVSVEPAEENVTVNGTQTFEVVVENATDDIKGYEFNISLSNGNAAEITNVSPRANPSEFNANSSQDGTTVAVDAFWLTSGDVFQSNSPTILEVEVQGVALGQVDLDTDLASASGPFNDLLAGPYDSYNVTASNAASITVEPPSPEFEVSNLSAPTSVSAGDVATATAKISNVGTARGNETVEFRIGGTSVNSTDVTLAAGDSRNVSLSVNTSGLGTGTFTQGFFVANSSQTAQITISNASVNLQIPGATDPVQDLDDDGQFEDLNGDGGFTPADVTALFTNRNSAAVQDNQELFDFNGDGGFTPADVTALFNQLL